MCVRVHIRSSFDYLLLLGSLCTDAAHDEEAIGGRRGGDEATHAVRHRRILDHLRGGSG